MAERFDELSIEDLRFVEEGKFKTEQELELFCKTKQEIDKRLSPPYPLIGEIDIEVNLPLPESVLKKISQEYQEVGWEVEYRIIERDRNKIKTRFKFK
ncbi:hypothetical protein J7J81_01105 [bacterium]|nr:hypothetical protein [bacterium]